MTEGIYSGIANNYTHTDTTTPYIGWLRIYSPNAVNIATLTNVVRTTNNTGGIRALVALPGVGGAVPTLAQVLTTSNQTGAGRSIIYQDSSATPNTVSIAAPSSITTSYNLKLPVAQAASSGQVLANDGSGNLSWATSSSGTQLYSTVPFKTTGGGPRIYLH